jgi:hypothetical protein
MKKLHEKLIAFPTPSASSNSITSLLVSPISALQ